MTIQEHRLRIPALQEKVKEACEFVSRLARAAGMNDDAIHRYYLAIEEICTNIIEHGYSQADYADQQPVIDLVCRQYPDRLSVTILDDAIPFNPLERAEPNPTTALEEREGGGWGIFFVKKYMDRVTYQYAEQRNQLTLEKRIR
ncbi:MAG: ATP-binding protein [Chloroflexi bacterium]|nr:MAG: ATP-binding protein [Chloroflexota bacterium]